MGRQNPETSDKTYRISLVEDSTHKTIKTFRFSSVRLIYAILSGSILALGLVWCLFALTPLRMTIPGYPDGKVRKAAVTNAIKIDSLENAVTRWTLYAENLSRVLTGEESFNYDSIMLRSNVKYISEKNAEALAEKEAQLRETVRQEEQFGVSNTQRLLPIEGMHFFVPVKGVVAKSFDRISHSGIDISVSNGAVVSAVLDGSVIFSAWDDENGYMVIIQHKGNIISIYQNNQRLLCKAGDSVKAGTPIAIAGSSINKTQTDHMHFELWHDGEALDPQNYISF